MYAGKKELTMHPKDTKDMQLLRALSSGADLKRPREDWVLETYFEILNSGSPDNSSVRSYLPHSDLVYCRAALETKFGRIFSLAEVKELIFEVYGVKYQ